MNRYLAKAIAFCGLVAGATVVEINGYTADGLWLLVGLWVIFGTWSEVDRVIVNGNIN